MCDTKSGARKHIYLHSCMCKPMENQKTKIQILPQKRKIIAAKISHLAKQQKLNGAKWIFILRLQYFLTTHWTHKFTLEIK